MGGGGLLLGVLLCLGWGRGGLLGEGSSVVELWENLVLWFSPEDIDVLDFCGVLFPEGGGGLIF